MQATSVYFGKLYMMAVPSGNKQSYSSFLEGTSHAWYSSNLIPIL